MKDALGMNHWHVMDGPLPVVFVLDTRFFAGCLWVGIEE